MDELPDSPGSYLVAEDPFLTPQASLTIGTRGALTQGRLRDGMCLRVSEGRTDLCLLGDWLEDASLCSGMGRGVP